MPYVGLLMITSERERERAAGATVKFYDALCGVCVCVCCCWKESGRWWVGWGLYHHQHHFRRVNHAFYREPVGWWKRKSHNDEPNSAGWSLFIISNLKTMRQKWEKNESPYLRRDPARKSSAKVTLHHWPSSSHPPFLSQMSFDSEKRDSRFLNVLFPCFQLKRHKK